MPIPQEVLLRVIDKLHELGTFTLELTGGEPLLNPDLIEVFEYARARGIPRRRMITNGFLLTRSIIEELNRVELYHLAISIDGVNPNRQTEKVLSQLTKRLELLKAHAQFPVTLNAVLGATNDDEAMSVIEYALANGFRANLNILHDGQGQVRLDERQLARYREVVTRIHGKHYDVRGDYRWRLVNHLDADFACRAGSRYLYIDEFQRATWCSQTRASREFKSLWDYTWDDMREQFHTPKPCSANCTVGCARRVSRLDLWRR